MPDGGAAKTLSVKEQIAAEARAILAEPERGNADGDEGVGWDIGELVAPEERERKSNEAKERREMQLLTDRLVDACCRGDLGGEEKCDGDGAQSKVSKPFDDGTTVEAIIAEARRKFGDRANMVINLAKRHQIGKGIKEGVWCAVTPLLAACRFGHSQVARRLVDMGADLDANDVLGDSSLIHASRCGHLGTVNMLGKANHDAANIKGETALIVAVSSERENSSAIAGKLILGGCDVNVQDASGTSALMIAARLGKYRMVKRLCNAGADVEAADRHKRTAMHHAARYGHQLVCVALVDNISDVDVRDRNGWTPLMYASRWNRTSVAEYLIDQGALVNVRERKEGKSALSFAAERAHRKIVKLLLRNDDTDSHLRDIYGKKPLDLVPDAASNNLALASALEEHMEKCDDGGLIQSSSDSSDFDDYDSDAL